MDVEETLLRAFIVPERRSHYTARLATQKTRKKLLGSFYHLHDLDPRFAHRIEPSLQRADWIYEALRKRGAPERCYVMSASSDLDGQETDLRPAGADRRLLRRDVPLVHPGAARILRGRGTERAIHPRTNHHGSDLMIVSEARVGKSVGKSYTETGGFERSKAESSRGRKRAKSP